MFDPIYFYGGQEAAKTYLGHLKLGFVTPYVEFETGYKYAKLPPHNSAIWTTIKDNWDAGYGEVGGYNAFKLGSALQEVGDVKLNATIIPNKTADRAGNRYGLAAWASAEYEDHYVDLQYNGVYGKSFDAIFDEILELDLIVGYSGTFGPIGLKANAVFNQYGSIFLGEGTKALYVPAGSDVGAVNDEIGRAHV